MNTTDSTLQDYLDDRMTAEQRSAFQRRLEREPDLAARLAEQLRVRAALCEEEALPPGFYTRTRSEFVRRKGSKKRLGFGVLSWEALGLAAAAGLALALFVPGLMRDELPTARSIDDMTLSPEISKAEEVAPAAAEAFGDYDADESDKVSGEKVATAPLEERQTRAKAAPSPAVTDAPEPQDQKKRDFNQGAAPADGGRDDADLREQEPTTTEPSAADDAERKGVFAPSPPTAGASAQSPSVPTSVVSEYTVNEELEDSSTVRRSRLEAVPAELDEFHLARAIPLGVGSVPRYAVRSLPSEQARELLSAPGKNEVGFSKDVVDPEADRAYSAKEQTDKPAERAVLIGPRGTPFSCVGVRVETSPGEHVVYLASVGPGRPAADGGCAVYLPADDRRVIVVDPAAGSSNP